MIIVTGGAGFIGSHFILDFLESHQEGVINIDKLTYAANLDNLEDIQHLKNFSDYNFIQADINDQQTIQNVFYQYQPRAIVHFAAESHVDRSITGPAEFIQTNILGTFNLLECAKKYWEKLSDDIKKSRFRFLHVSTDEVYGSLDNSLPAFTETSAYAPNSPYSASKAASDHLVRSYYHTYGLPVLTTNCSNNYGPHQFSEKLIPFMINNALAGRDLPIYGDGKNVRDWLYVKDHTEALRVVLEKGQLGEVYNIGGNCEKTNIEVVHHICDILDKLKPLNSIGINRISSYRERITFIQDRPGHDKRYAINASKIKQTLGWSPKENFETGLLKTIQWYLQQLQVVQDNA